MTHLTDGTPAYTDEELIELGRSALKETKDPKRPTVFSKAWDEIKEPFVFTGLIITGFALALANMIGCFVFGEWISGMLGTGVGVTIIVAISTMVFSIGVWWYCLAILKLILEEKGYE